MVGKKLARGISLMMVGQLTGNIIGLTSTLVMAALLIPEDFGVFALATSFVTIISAMFDLQTSSVLIQMPDPKKEDFDTVFTLNLLRGLVLCLGVCALAWPIAASVGDERLFPLLLLLSLQPLLLALRNPYFERFAKEMSFAPTTFVDLIAKVLSFVGSVGYAIICPSYWALACGVLLSAAAGTMATFVASRELPGLSLASFKKIFSFSIWLGLSALMNQLRSVSDRIILGIGMNAVTLGFYALALQIVVQIMTSMMKPFNWAMFSGFSQFNQDKERLREAYRKSHAAMGTVILPSAAGLFLISEPLILTFFGTKWENSILFIKFAAASYFFLGVSGPFWALGMAMGKTKLLFWRSLLSVVVIVVFQLIGLFYFGVIGFLIAGLSAAGINSIISMHLVRQVIEIPYARQVTHIIRPFAASLAMVPGVFVLQAVLPSSIPNWGLLGGQLIVGVGVFGAVLFALWRLSGSPDGPERIGMSILNDVRGRLRRPQNVSGSAPND